MENHKRCAKCKQFKLFSEFGLKKEATDGLKSYCKTCMTLASRESHSKKIKKLCDEAYIAGYSQGFAAGKEYDSTV